MTYKTILLVEDEAGIREMTAMYLRQRGYRMITAENADIALRILRSISPHLILLDIEMPGMDGFTLCEKIREILTVPIIFLTVRRDVMDKVKCFELGGDDYMTKPYDFDELDARIKANIRRYFTYPEDETNILKYRDLEIHVQAFKCYLGGKEVDLSTKEMELLIHLAKHPNQVWNQEELYDKIWSLDAVGHSDTVKVHISHLRRKLKDNQEKKQFIETVRGFGYRFSG